MDKGEGGFTLAEVLVTIVILASLAVVLAELTQSYIRAWERTNDRIEEARIVLAQVEKIGLAEENSKEREGAVLWLETNDNRVQNIILATPKIDSAADCLYDQVARRCR